MNSITVKSNIHDYPIFFEPGLSFLQNLLQAENSIYIVDENILKHYPAILNGINPERLIRFNAIEENKNLRSAENFLDGIIAKKPNKKTTLVSIGGGITQDVSGFAASVFYRGIRWIYVPTTLLSQADSCMGSKTSLNFKSFKNILGTFYPPHEIYLSADFLLTLKEEDFYSGMGEIAKLHLMSGEKDTNHLISKLDSVAHRDLAIIPELTKRSLQIKLSYMEGDEFDTGKRNLLNFGHCFGHAIESATNYRIPHGQAILIGMIIANSVSVAQGLMQAAMRDKLNDSLLFPLLKSDYKMLRNIPAEAVVNSMKQDKKRTGAGLTIILLSAGHLLSKITDFPEAEAKTSYLQFVNEYCRL